MTRWLWAVFVLCPLMSFAQPLRVGSKQFTESVMPMPSGASRARSVAMSASEAMPLSSSCVSVPVYSG